MLQHIVQHLRNRIGELEAPTSQKGEIFRARSERGELSVLVNSSNEQFVDLFFAAQEGASETLVGAVTEDHLDGWISKL